MLSSAWIAASPWFSKSQSRMVAALSKSERAMPGLSEKRQRSMVTLSAAWTPKSGSLPLSPVKPISRRTKPD
ncbi:hypothetical protein D3C87_1965390 [compost metagenome]